MDPIWIPITCFVLGVAALAAKAPDPIVTMNVRRSIIRHLREAQLLDRIARTFQIRELHLGIFA